MSSRFLSTELCQTLSPMCRILYAYAITLDCIFVSTFELTNSQDKTHLVVYSLVIVCTRRLPEIEEAFRQENDSRSFIGSFKSRKEGKKDWEEGYGVVTVAPSRLNFNV